VVRSQTKNSGEATEKPGGLRSRSASAETPGKSHHPKQTRNRSLAAAYFATASKAKKATKARTRRLALTRPSLVSPRTVAKPPDARQAQTTVYKGDAGASGVRGQSGVGSQDSGLRARTPTGFHISARGWTIGTTPGFHAKKIPALERPERLSKLPPNAQTKHPATPRTTPGQAKQGQESGVRHKAPTTKHGASRPSATAPSGRIALSGVTPSGLLRCLLECKLAG
jgi:hypothetical protein